ncbi:MAG: MBL fold metallo-hydrolase [Mesorhizobium sp.]|nr:MAG: MBL fold metallo-hydrolase [Mesorhizobium sp.]
MSYEVDFLPVGDSNGDAIVIRYGSPQQGYLIHVVDGGFTDTGTTIVSHIDHYYGARRIDHVVVTHSDSDHVAGLIEVVESFYVGAIWMNLPWLYVDEVIDDFDPRFTRVGLRNRLRSAYPYLLELERIARQRRIPVFPVFAGTQIGAFTVLAPTRDRYVSLIKDFPGTPRSFAVENAPNPFQQASGLGIGGLLSPSANPFLGAAVFSDQQKWYHENWTHETLSYSETSAPNESSVVQLGILDGQRILLTADAGPVALNEAADVADILNLRTTYPYLVQVPHHGSRRNVNPSVLDRWLGGTMQVEGAQFGWAVCSVGANKPEYPRRRVSNAFMRRGYPVLATRTMTQTFTSPGVPLRAGWGVGVPVPFASSFKE